MLLFHSTKKTSLERLRRLELECANVAAVPEDLAAVNIKKTRLSQSDYFSLFAVEESVVEDQLQLFLFQPSDLWDRGISATDFRATVSVNKSLK